MSAPTTEFDAVGMTIFARTDALIMLVDDALRLVAINDAAAQAVGLVAGSAVGLDAAIFTAARHAPEFRRALRDAAKGMSSMQEHLLADLETDRHRSIAWSVSRVRENPCLVVCVGIDVTARREERADANTRAFVDDLTGLPNRAGLFAHMAVMAGTGASVIACHVDEFGAVRDALGSAAADSVLAQTARRLTRTVRGEDFVARVDDDTFAVVVPPDADASFEGLARRLLRAIGQPMVAPGPVAATVAMSLGRASLDRGLDPAVVLAAAIDDPDKLTSRQPTRTTADVVA